MRKVITYGTYDLLHYGHIRLLERARALGDYLIVGVTADSFDKVRGKINVSQSLAERIESVRATGLADEIIVEEYEGQKIDDIKNLKIDVFTVGSDWKGHFDYLCEYCEVVYLDRTEGVSSTEIRTERSALRLGFIGDSREMIKHVSETKFVNGLEVSGSFDPYRTEGAKVLSCESFASYKDLLALSDAVFVISQPKDHFKHVTAALLAGKHVICESPLALTEVECCNLFDLANTQGVVLFEALKTAYATAYHRLLLLVQSGRIGRIVSIQATCTSLFDLKSDDSSLDEKWTAADMWLPTVLLPVFQLLGTKPVSFTMYKSMLKERPDFDAFGKIDLVYDGAIGSALFGKAIKSEGSLIISGTDGYVYVPAPWWKTDYFEIRREDQSQNRCFFYQLDGEGIRYELASFARTVESGNGFRFVEKETSVAIARLFGEFVDGGRCILLDSIEGSR